MSRQGDTQKKKIPCPPRSETHSVFLSLGTVLLCTSLFGCGPDSKFKKVIVRGTVTLDGQPIQNGEIRFYPVEGTPGSVSGGPIKDGQYVAKGRGGVSVGKSRVEIRGYRPPPESPGGEVSPGMEEGRPAVQYLPAKYNTQSELTATIESDSGNAAKDFNLSVE
ncbi:MAG: hypothetical protein GXP26_07225 [Planctomycetes bacterium]|nr:hypothetical protein [Planctomycetota bacterium]